MIVDENGKFISQRTHPQLALIRFQYRDQQLKVYCGSQNWDLLLSQNRDPHARGPLIDIQVWDSQFKAELCDPQISQAFSDFLKQKVHVVKYVESQPRREKLSRFSDGGTFLFLNEKTLLDVNSYLKSAVTLDRFRGNVIFEGACAWEENQWNQIQVGENKFGKTKLCTRCPVINIDQESGQVSDENLLQLLASKFKVSKKIVFGGYFKFDSRLENKEQEIKNQDKAGSFQLKVGDFIHPISEG